MKYKYEYNDCEYEFEYEYLNYEYEYEYEYIACEYEYEFEYNKFVLELYSSMSTSTEYYISVKYTGVGKLAIFDGNGRLSRKRSEIGRWLL